MQIRAFQFVCFSLVLFSLSSLAVAATSDHTAAETHLAKVQALASKGDATAEYKLGTAYYHGHILAKSDAEAVKWWQKSAEQGDSMGEVMLGMAYHLGIGGLVKDDVQAMAWNLKSARQGNSLAEAVIGAMYHKGDGVPQNSTEAIKWWLKAARKDEQMAMSYLGTAYHEGDGVRQDDFEAVKWWRKSADYGDAVGLDGLGCAYLMGWGGLKKDPVQAYMWLSIAADREKRPNEKPRIVATLLHEKRLMTKDQIDAAEREIKTWRPRTHDKYAP